MSTSTRGRARRSNSLLSTVIARSEATKQSSSVHRALDCFASLAMTRHRRIELTTFPVGRP
ncbi:hypothetical protein DY468_07340 [Rhodopseudomonas sp. BR0M22]|nr:hypothetical protein [Rhodopseudomonas sp. BR0M22]